jgi:diguanylate cyclase
VALVVAALCGLRLVAPNAVGLAALVASSVLPCALLGSLLVRGRLTPRLPWSCVVGALAALSAHNVESLRQVGLLGRDAAVGPLFVWTLPIGYAGLLVAALILCFRYARSDLGGVVDAVLIAIAGASALWAALVGPVLIARDTAPGTIVYTFVIILLVSGIAGGVGRATNTSHAARPALGYFVVAVGATLLGNVMRAVGSQGNSGSNRVLDCVWIVAYLALAGAATHPAHIHFATPPPHVEGGIARRRLVLLGGVLAVHPLIAVVQSTVGPVEVPLLLAGTLLVIPLVMLRVWQLAQLHVAAQARLERLATHDALTDLANRRALDEHIRPALARVAGASSPGLVLLFLDLDGFKTVNDTYGHRVGDALLVAVARRLRTAVRASDVVGRLGGDEFVVLLEGDPEIIGYDAVERVRAALRLPADLEGLLVPVDATVGVARVRAGESTTPDELLAAADADMYARKGASRGGRSRTSA